MKLLLLLLAAACLTVAQDQPKNLAISTDSGAMVSLRAQEILREPNLIHLKGNVEIHTWWVGQPYTRSVVTVCDEAVYHIDTGEIEPQGKVSVKPVVRQSPQPAR